MESSVREGAGLRELACFGLACVVMAFFVVGLVFTTLVRSIRGCVAKAIARTDTHARTVYPSRLELQTVVAALMMFAEAVAEEALAACWKAVPE